MVAWISEWMKVMWQINVKILLRIINSLCFFQLINGRMTAIITKRPTIYVYNYNEVL